MEFKIILEVDSAAQHKSSIIVSLSQELNSFFEKKNYGEDIQCILVGCICVKAKKGYEDWFRVRKPKYTDYKKIKNRLTGVDMEIIKTFEYEFKIDDMLYDDFILSHDEESRRIIANEIIYAFENSIVLPKKIKDFDKEKFIFDLKLFFNQK